MQEQARYNSRYRPIDTNLPNIGTAEIVDKPKSFGNQGISCISADTPISSRYTINQQLPAGLSTLKKMQGAVSSSANQKA